MDNNFENKKKSFTDRIKSSAIITFLLFIADLIYCKLDQGFYGRLATSYDSENKAAQECGAYSAVKKLRWGERVSRPIKQTIARCFEQSFILGKISYFIDTLL